jgi:hypothetical protein
MTDHDSKLQHGFEWLRRRIIGMMVCKATRQVRRTVVGSKPQARAKGRPMILNTWTCKWNGHQIEVRNHFLLAELLIDVRLADRVRGVFRHDLRATLCDGRIAPLSRPCPNEICRHDNHTEAQFCARCGQQLDPDWAGHDVRAAVTVHFPPPRIKCRIAVDVEEILRED